MCIKKIKIKKVDNFNLCVPSVYGLVYHNVTFDQFLVAHLSSVLLTGASPVAATGISVQPVISK